MTLSCATPGPPVVGTPWEQTRRSPTRRVERAGSQRRPDARDSQHVITEHAAASLPSAQRPHHIHRVHVEQTPPRPHPSTSAQQLAARSTPHRTPLSRRSSTRGALSAATARRRRRRNGKRAPQPPPAPAARARLLRERESRRQRRVGDGGRSMAAGPVPSTPVTARRPRDWTGRKSPAQTLGR